MPLKLLKESNPVEVAEFFTTQNIVDEPAFAWWVKFFLTKCDRIISAVNSRVQKATHKFGIKITTSVADCARLGKENGNTMWMDSLTKEMTAVGIEFEILEDDEHLMLGYTKSSRHLIFDVNMDFT